VKDLIARPGHMVMNLIPDNFYGRAFSAALARINYPTKEDFTYEVQFTENYMVIWMALWSPNFDLQYDAAMETQKTRILNRQVLKLTDIPLDEAKAQDIFVYLLFRFYMEFTTHELMESFAVDNKRFRNPHERGIYQGNRKNVRPNGTRTLWRNHVMWEACMLVAQENPPDYRSFLDRKLDEIVDFDMAVEQALKARIRAVRSHYWSWRAIVKIKLTGSFQDAARYSLAMARMMARSLISGQF
jgi:hypothetical protein